MSHALKAQVVYNVPITVVLEGTGCDWSLDAKGSLRYEPAQFTHLTEDPWGLLNRFMGLKTEAEALAFLNETGYFSLFNYFAISYRGKLSLSVSVFRPVSLQLARRVRVGRYLSCACERAANKMGVRLHRK